MLRRIIYDTIFVNPWTTDTLSILWYTVLPDQHGPQSLLEALLAPIFGWGFLASRLMVGCLGLVAVIFIFAWGAESINRWLGLSLALTVGITPYFMYFARYGDSEHVNVYWHAFLLLLGAQLVVNRGRLRDFALLGFASGLAIWVYATNQFLLILVLISLFSIGLLRLKDLGLNRRRLGGVCLATAVGLVVSWPQFKYYSIDGKIFPLRTPYGSPLHEITSFSSLPQRYVEAWVSLFSGGGYFDPWFSRPHGALTDWSLLLLIPGLYVMIRLLIHAVADRRDLLSLPHKKNCSHPNFYGIFFLSSITILFLVFGVLPGALSPENAFRRMILVPIGFDIIRALGLYGVLFALTRRMSVVPRGLLIITCVTGFSLWQWHAFFYDSFSHESNSTNSLTESVKAVSRQFKEKGQATILASTLPGTLSPETISNYVAFDFGFPHEMPQKIHVISVSELYQNNFKEVIVPSPTLAVLKSDQGKVLPGVAMSNVRESANLLGATFALVDFSSTTLGSP